MALPDPALVVLVGPSGSGKSTWAAGRYRAAEVVSSDALRAVVGSGPQDLDASADAFDVLETVVAARLSRGLTTVVDTLGTDVARRRRWLALARDAGLPAVTVVVDTDPATCRERNAQRDRPVPAPVLAQQLARHARAVDALAVEGWDAVEVVSGNGPPAAPDPGPAPTSPRRVPGDARRTSQGLEVVLQLSRFPWGEDPMSWLREVALAADAVGFAGIAPWTT